MEILKDTVGSLWFVQYGLGVLSVIGLLFLLVTMRPDLSYFTGRFWKHGGRREKAQQRGK